MNILVLNAGSNSLKFDLIQAEPGQTTPTAARRLGSGALDDIGKKPGAPTSYAEAADQALQQLTAKTSIDLIAHRVVHGGDEFRSPAWIDDHVLSVIQRWEEAAPLHNTAALEVIRRVCETQKAPGVAVFDTAFHAALPETAYTYALPYDLAKELGIRRYGFHGISHRYQMLRYAELNQADPANLRLITLHLEGGSSAAAIRNGQSVDTSMGFTPLEGLPMASRCGDIDPALVSYIARKRGIGLDQVDRILNRESGLFGLSGISGDTRVLLKQIGEERARLALEVFSHRVLKYVSAYLGVLGGADGIVFSGGIGENTPFVRVYVCEQLRWCGLDVDPELNRTVLSGDVRLTRPGSRIQAWAIHADEALMIAHEAVNHPGPSR